MKRFHSALQGGLLLAMLGVTAPAFGAIQVGLEVDQTTSPPSLKVVSNTSQCPGGAIDCIEVAKKDQPFIYFNLPKACKADGPAYRLAEFRIAEQQKAWPTPSKPMNSEIAKDFCADRTNGYVHFSYCGNDLKDDKMKLKDHNLKAGTVWYEIKAESCDGAGGAIRLDPQIKNTGQD